MRSRIHTVLIMGTILFFTVTQATAQEEQWLQYHSAREIYSVKDGLDLQSLALSTEKPIGIGLPAFRGESPYFAKWATPMSRAGYVWIALDRRHKQGPYNELYIDTNGNGHLSDETVMTAYRMDQNDAFFGPVKVLFEIEDGPVTYHLNLRSYAYDEHNQGLYASSGGWYEGDITVAGVKKRCALFDYNANGTFNDKSMYADKCDRIRIGEEVAQRECFVGNYIEVDNILYTPEIARDGAFVKLIKAESVKFGSVRLLESVTQISVNGENGLFILKPEKNTASLPVGRYRVHDWAIEREDDNGSRQWKLQGSGPAGAGTFDITEGKEIMLSIGEPIISTLEVSEKEGTHSFRHTLKGRDGEAIELTCNGTRPRAPKVRIITADGTYDRTYSLEYG